MSIFLFTVLFVGGTALVVMTARYNVRRLPAFFLATMGIATMVFMVLVVVAFIKSGLTGLTVSNSLESIEGLFYLTSLLFLVGAPGSMVTVHLKGALRTSGS